MGQFSFDNPLFATYAIAAALLILKGALNSWFVVVAMIRENGGFRSPEDMKKTPSNPKPHPGQLDINPRVDRLRRIQLNDLESFPYFLVAGLLWIMTAPSLLLAQWLFYGYVVTRLLHFIAYLTARIHDIRAAIWTPGSLILIYMAGSTLVAALHH